MSVRKATSPVSRAVQSSHESRLNTVLRVGISQQLHMNDQQLGQATGIVDQLPGSADGIMRIWHDITHTRLGTIKTMLITFSKGESTEVTEATYRLFETADKAVKLKNFPDIETTETTLNNMTVLSSGIATQQESYMPTLTIPKKPFEPSLLPRLEQELRRSKESSKGRELARPKKKMVKERRSVTYFRVDEATQKIQKLVSSPNHKILLVCVK